MVATRITGSKIKILVLHNGVESGVNASTEPAPDGPIDVDPALKLTHLRGLADGLSGAGFDVALVDAEDNTQRITHAVVVEQPSLVFLVDHFRGETLRHPNVASLLELHGLIYTGSDPLCLSTCRDRVRTYLLLSDAEIPLPGHAVVRDINAIPDTDALGSPLMVSHSLADVYDDPDAREVASSRAEIEERAGELAAGVGLPLLIEQFIEGRRLQAIVLGNRVLEVLPLAERAADPAGRLGPARVAQLDVDTADTIRALAQRAFRVMGCRDCAQVDFALDRDGQPHVINVHPLFDMFPGSPFVVSAGASELGFAGAVGHLAEIALDRAALPQPEPTEPLPPPPEPEVPEAEASEPRAEASEPQASEPEPPPEPQPEAPAADRRPRPATPRRRPASRARPGARSPAPPRPPRKKKPAPAGKKKKR
jgi:D-alanine-D-alanine ligase-like ATP-grasp enzyme